MVTALSEFPKPCPEFIEGLRTGYTLAGALTDFVTKPIRNLRRLRRLTTFQDGHETEGGRWKGEDGKRNTQYAVRNTNSDPGDIIWALRDVSFEVQRGEVVGTITAIIIAISGAFYFRRMERIFADVA